MMGSLLPMPIPRIVASTAIALACLSATTGAQTTRAEEIAAAQAEKAAAMPADEPGWLERTVVAIRRAAVESPSGPYPSIDGVYQGGGPTGGLGYRQYLGDRTYVNVRGLYSTKHYRTLESSLASRGHRRGTVDLGLTALWLDAPEVGYFGLGPDNDDGDRANFRLRQTVVGGQITARPRRPFVFSAAAAAEFYDIGAGRGSEPSIEQRYSAAEAPGLGRSPSYAHTTLTAGVDSRPSAGYARRGGSYELLYHRFDRGGGYAFDRLDVDVVQHLPLLRHTYVVSGHVRLQSTLGTDDVPYFLLPSLGGGRTLRAYDSWQFRDRHALLVQGEFRWVPNLLGIDMAIFWDGGTVTAVRGDLSLGRFAHDVGVGLRLHTPAATPIRVELAHGNSGLKLVMAAKAVF
jgi:hypothetical protein